MRTTPSRRYVLKARRRRLGDPPPAATRPPPGRQSADSDLPGRDHDDQMGVLASARCLEGHIRVETRHCHRLVGALGHPGLIQTKDLAETIHQHLNIAAQLAGTLFEDLHALPTVRVRSADEAGYEVPLAAMAADNEGDLGDEIRALEVGQTIEGGGGAAPAFTIKRVR
jgi:hypothetical protein